MVGRRSSVALATALIGVCASSASALDGATPLQFTAASIAGTDWRIIELYTGGNTITGIADDGYTQKARFDGIGAYAQDANTVRVVFNHELTSAVHPNGSSVSYLDLNRTNLKNWLVANTATPAAQVVNKIGTAFTSINGSATLGNFCSSALFEPNRFGAGRGFASRLYMTGEEITGSGDEYALDLDQASPTFRQMFEVSASNGVLPNGAFENVAQFDTGRTDKIGLLMFEDAGSDTTNGTAPMRMWIGNKDSSPGATFLQKNGLASGQLYYWIPSGTGTSAPQRFTSTGTTIAGGWSTSATGAMLFSKLEDGDISPTSGMLAAFNCQDQGTFTAQLTVNFNLDGTLNTTTSGASIKLVLEEANDGGAVLSFNNQDNMTWSTANLLFTQEDGDTKQIWQLDPANPNAAFPIATVTGAAGESSGILDVSALFGYVPGSILLTDAHSNTLGDNQMVLMFSPNAQLVPEPSASLALLGLGGLLLKRGRGRARA
jgi:glycerophosphoryl diester phosphodiesterase